MRVGRPLLGTADFADRCLSDLSDVDVQCAPEHSRILLECVYGPAGSQRTPRRYKFHPSVSKRENKSQK